MVHIDKVEMITKIRKYLGQELDYICNVYELLLVTDYGILDDLEDHMAKHSPELYDKIQFHIMKTGGTYAIHENSNTEYFKNTKYEKYNSPARAYRLKLLDEVLEELNTTT
jgi:hypothetical protein